MTSTKYNPPNMINSVKEGIQQPQQAQNIGSMNQQQIPMQIPNQGQGQPQNGQSPQNQYQVAAQMQNEVNFKKNRTSSQTPPTQSSSNTINISQQQGTNSGYIPGGSNQSIQQQIQAPNSNQNIPQNQGSKIS